MSSERKTLKVLFHSRLIGMRQLVNFDELSNVVDTTGNVQCMLWLAELQSLTVDQRGLERNMDVNFLHEKEFGSGTTN
jgi:hypothetical protein